MLRIELYIPEKTIELEKSREPESMALEDILYWCFSVAVEFVEASSKKPLLSIPDASLFQMLDGLARARNKAINKTGSKVQIDDREGGFTLSIETIDGLTRILEGFTNRGFEVRSEDFLQATNEFIDSAIRAAEAAFPKLLPNRNYQRLVASLKNPTDLDQMRPGLNGKCNT